MVSEVLGLQLAFERSHTLQVRTHVADRVVMIVLREEPIVPLCLLLRILRLDVEQDFLVFQHLSLKVFY